MDPRGTLDWIEDLPAAVTVTTADGTILAMNRRACKTFEKDGGATLVGQNVFDCHPEPARTKTRELYERRAPNHYTIQKNGVKKIIHQLPWYQDEAFAGFVEISIPIPEEMPNFERG